jgi:prepilin-type N-terminal cleavage/methylation domain-containing protein/prepilin-type processing-associated H-X9-DG protein
MMHRAPPQRGFTLLELVISLAVIVLLLAALVPALTSARQDSYRERCATNHRILGQAWHSYLEDHDGVFPYVPDQPGWHYAGVRFSIPSDEPFIDSRRPLSLYLPRGGTDDGHTLQCPSDCGISGETGEVGTGGRTACRSFGTSYRANAALLDAQVAGIADAHRGLARAEIMTVPSRLVVLGDPVWYEAFQSTGREATWHGDAGQGNLLFLDGSVKYMPVWPKERVGPVAIMPRLITPADD